MTENLCVRCGRPTPDGYACTTCAHRAGDQLHEIAEMSDAARDVAHGLSSRQNGSGGSGKPGSRLPLDLAATARLDAVNARLSRWCAFIARQRGMAAPWFDHHGDPVAAAAQFLAGHVEWIRHRAPDHNGEFGAEEFLDHVDACARVVRGLARGPSEQRFLGPCGADITLAMAEDGIFPPEAVGGICDGDVYAYRGARVGRCRTCDAEVATSEREAWLDGEVRSRAFRASEIEDAYKVSANLIRQWATPERGLIAIHGHDTQGRALYLLSQVLEVAAAQKAKQAEAQAKRARKAATRAADDAA